MATIGADYLVIGAGAMGMAFADVIVTETAASIVIVDRCHQPGGHWTTHPDSDIDWLTMTCANNRNLMRWLDDQDLMTWLDSSRLDLLGHLRPRASADPAQFAVLAGQIKARLGAANDKLSALLERGQ